MAVGILTTKSLDTREQEFNPSTAAQNRFVAVAVKSPAGYPGGQESDDGRNRQYQTQTAESLVSKNGYRQVKVTKDTKRHRKP